MTLMIKRKGFTLIELLVVLTIIGVLSGVINTAFIGVREKAKDSVIKQSLSSIRNSAEEVYYRTYPNTYLPVCFDTMVDLILKDTAGLGDATGVDFQYQCLSTNQAWVAIFPLSDGSYWCSDGLGRSIGVDGFIEYASEEYLDCFDAVSETPEVIEPPSGDGSPVPVLTLAGASTITIWSPSGNPFKGGAWHKFHEPGFTSIDAQDGDITTSVLVNGPNLESTTGPKSCRVYTYTVEYSITDSNGNFAGPEIRTVIHNKCNEP